MASAAPVGPGSGVDVGLIQWEVEPLDELTDLVVRGEPGVVGVGVLGGGERLTEPTGHAGPELEQPAGTLGRPFGEDVVDQRADGNVDRPGQVGQRGERIEM